MGFRNQTLGFLNEVVLLVVLVVSFIVTVSAILGISLDNTMNTVTAPVDRSLSGITGEHTTYQAAYRPGSVAVASPSQSAVVEPGIVSFSWAANAETDGVDRYRITVQKYINLKVIGFWVPAGSKAVRCNMGLSCTSTSAMLALDGSYRWKVQAHNGAGWGRSSGYHHFFTR